jgi:hypothetical protein
MSSHRTHRRHVLRVGTAFLPILLVLGLVGPTVAAPTPTQPSVRLLRSARKVQLESHEGRVALDLGVYVTPVGGDFIVNARKETWYSPPTGQQVDTRGNVVRRLPAEMVDDFSGLKDFAKVTFYDEGGTKVASTKLTFCPNPWERQRVTDQSVPESIYPATGCETWFPFTRGDVWGIDQGWASPLQMGGDDWSAGGIRVPPGRYTVRVNITQAYARLLGVAGKDREVTLRARVRAARVPPEEPEHIGATGDDLNRMMAQADTPRSPEPGVRTMDAAPAEAQLPDLAAVPAWALEATSENDRDLLTFASTPWNRGPGVFAVEGFRRPNRDAMDAYQYLYDAAGKVQGRVPIGDMVYHAGGGHDHWHFLQFARFDLLDRDRNRVVKSQKQGFCIVPTDAVDLTRRGAVLRPWNSGGGSSCGGQTSLWVREVLPAGWGDTYFNVEGQAFDITRVPNGRYLVRVRVDPERRLAQQSTSNDVAFRKIKLGGSRGARTVEVSPWRGLDG